MLARRELHVEKPFKIDKVPSDTQMREILDGIDLEPLHEGFADLRRHKMRFLLGAKPGDHEHLFDQVVKCFSWVTDLDLSEKSLYEYQRAGRSRWRGENETFNTLKNQGYRLEHNYGHGQENLTTVLALLMFLAFTIDQIQESCCGLFAAAVHRAGRRVRLWESIRSHLRHFEFESFADLYGAIASGKLCKPPPA